MKAYLSERSRCLHKHLNQGNARKSGDSLYGEEGALFW